MQGAEKSFLKGYDWQDMKPSPEPFYILCPSSDESHVIG